MFQNIDKNNLHHAYLIEGDRDILLPEILAFIESMGVRVVNNSDFSHVMADSFKVEDARSLKALSVEKSSYGNKRVFLISANNFLLEAQNTLLKMFEEPIENTIFFLLVPDKNTLVKTLVSRFYFISARQDLAEEVQQAEKFIKMPPATRIEFIKDLLKETDEEGDEDVITQNSARARALNFLNALESIAHKKMLDNSADKNFLASFCEHIFKVRKYLRMPGSSAKNLLESIALTVPNF